MVKVATERRSVTNPHYCDQTWSEPAVPMSCPWITDESRVPAYRVTYSFRGQPMPSDDFGNTYFTFSVYFRPDEIDPGLRQALSARTISRTDASKYFKFTTSRDFIQQLVINEVKSTFCDENRNDGNWTHTRPKCESSVIYKQVSSAAPNITVKVEPTSRLEEESATGRR